MATYTKETALYDTGAISADIADAGTKATNYLAADSSGIMVYDGTNGAQTPSSPSANTQNVFIDQDSLDIRKGTTVLATFGSNRAQIGKTSEGHINIESDEVNFYNGEKALCSFSAGGGSSNSLTNIWTKDGRILDIASIDFDADPVGIGDILLYPSTISMTARRSNNSKEARLTLQVATDFSTQIALAADWVRTNGDITVKNHLSSIGSTNGNSGTANISSASSPYSSVALSGAITITSGTWMLVGNAVFQANSNGVRYLDWHRDSTGLLHTAVTQQAVAVSGVTTRMQTTAIVSVPENTSYSMYLHCYQTSGSKLSVDYNWQIVRIM